MARKILGVFEVFLGIFEKTKEKKDRVLNNRTNLSKQVCYTQVWVPQTQNSPEAARIGPKWAEAKRT